MRGRGPTSYSLRTPRSRGVSKSTVVDSLFGTSVQLRFETIRSVDERDVDARAKHRLPKGLVPVHEAALTVCFKMGLFGAIPQSRCNWVAGALAQLCTLYVVSKDKRTVRPLTDEELRQGTFVEGGRRMTFADGHRPLGRIFVTRTALRGATATVVRLALSAEP